MILFFLFSYGFPRERYKKVHIDLENQRSSIFSDFNQVKLANGEEADIVISNKAQNSSKWDPSCTMELPCQPLHVYLNQKVKDDNMMLFVPKYGDNDKILDFYIRIGFIPVSSGDLGAKYELSQNAIDGFLQLPLNYSFLSLRETAVVYRRIGDRSSDLFCVRRNMSPFLTISRVIFIIYTILIILRIYYMILPMNMKSGNSDRFWFMTSNFVMLTHPRNLNVSNTIILRELIRTANRTGKDQSKILEINRFNDKVEFTRLNIMKIGLIYFVAYWTETFDEFAEPSKYSLEGSELHTKNPDTFSETLLHLSYHDGNPKIEIPIEIAEKKGSVCIESSVKKDLPFGQYSLHLSYIDCIHLSLINQMSDLTASPDEFKSFIESIFVRLDFSALYIIAINGSREEIIVEFYKNEEIKPLVKHCINMVTAEKIQQEISHKHINGYYFASNRLQIGRVSYYVLTGQLSDTLILDVPERMFHFIMSLLVSYHHSVLSSRGDSMFLLRISNLLKQTEIFSYIECVGSPTNILRTCGTVFGYEINKEVVEYFLNAIDEETKKKIIEINNRKELDQLIVVFKTKSNDNACISISSTSYFDETINKMMYTYLVEDISSFNNNSMRLEAAHEAVKTASDFLGIHKIGSDFSMGDAQSLSHELGYPYNISSLMDIIHNDDKNIDFSGLLSGQTQMPIRLISSLGYVVDYSIIRTTSDGGYFVFPSTIMRQLCAISKCGNFNDQINSDNDFFLIINDIETDKSLLIYEPRKLLEDIPLDVALQHIISKAQQDTIDIFNSNISKIRDSTENMTIRFSAKLATEFKGNCWYKFTLLSAGGKIAIFVFNNHTHKTKKLLIEKINKKAEALISSSQTFFWIFEDSKTEDYIYESHPNSGSLITINWYTLQKQSDEKSTSVFENAINAKADIDSEVVLSLDTIKKYIFRGCFKNDVLTGVATDITWIDQEIQVLYGSPAIESISCAKAKEPLKDAKLQINAIIQCLLTLPDVDEEKLINLTLHDISKRSLEKLHNVINL